MSFLELHAGASQVAQWQRTRLPMQGTWVQSLGREDSLERVANIKYYRQPTPVFLPGESHGQRSLAGCSPRGCKKSDIRSLLGNCLVIYRIKEQIAQIHSQGPPDPHI